MNIDSVKKTGSAGEPASGVLSKNHKTIPDTMILFGDLASGILSKSHKNILMNLSGEPECGVLGKGTRILIL